MGGSTRSWKSSVRSPVVSMPNTPCKLKTSWPNGFSISPIVMPSVSKLKAHLNTHVASRRVRLEVNVRLLEGLLMFGASRWGACRRCNKPYAGHRSFANNPCVSVHGDSSVC